MFEFFEISKTVQAHEADFKNTLRLDALFSYLQDTAAAHADKLNLGYTALIKHNYGWVLSWTKVDIASLPGFGEEITIKTWPKKKYKLYSLRDFIIYNQKREIIIRATTAWLPINITSKRIIDTSSLPGSDKLPGAGIRPGRSAGKDGKTQKRRVHLFKKDALYRYRSEPACK